MTAEVVMEFVDGRCRHTGALCNKYGRGAGDVADLAQPGKARTTSFKTIGALST
jgi:hypothetical protein